MTKENFTRAKDSIVSKIKLALSEVGESVRKKEDLRLLLDVINQYSFENRFEMKGVLSHTIVDSLEIEYSLADEIMSFDKRI